MTVFIYPKGSSEGHREGSRLKMSHSKWLIYNLLPKKDQGQVFLRCWGHMLGAYGPGSKWLLLVGEKSSTTKVGTEDILSFPHSSAQRWPCASWLLDGRPQWVLLPPCSDFRHLGLGWWLLRAVMPTWYEGDTQVPTSVFTFCVLKVISYIRVKHDATCHRGISPRGRATVMPSAVVSELAVHAMGLPSHAPLPSIGNRKWTHWVVFGCLPSSTQAKLYLNLFKVYTWVCLYPATCVYSRD